MSNVSAVQIPRPDAVLHLVDDPDEQAACTRWETDAQGRRIAETSLQLSGLHCAACAGLIEQALFTVDGVQAASVSAAAERATVRWDAARTRTSALIEAVRRAGYDAVPDAAAPARALRRQAQRQAVWRLFVAAFCAMQVMMLATPSYVAAPGELAPDLRQLLNWGAWLLSLPVMVFSATPFFTGAWRALRQRRIGMDVPVSLGIAIAFVASSGATFDPGGPLGNEVYFDTLTMFVAFLMGARFLELQTRHRAAEALEKTLTGLPEAAWRLGEDGSTEAVSVQRLRPGDRLRVPLGQAFPADGVLTQGRTQADESLLSGESTPVDKLEGDAVVAGSTNLGAPVLMRVERVGGDTRLQTIVAMVRGAMAQRPASAALADRWAGAFLWAVLLLAAGAAGLWSVIDPSRALPVAVAVLIVTCPCALSLATPATLVAAAQGLVRRGVLLQRIDAIERLASVEQVFFDKTGTLTEGRLQLRRLRLVPLPDGIASGLDKDRALVLAAGLAAWSSHPRSQAIVAALTASTAPAGEGPAGWHDIQEMPGRGVLGWDAHGREWRLGAADWACAVQPGAAEAGGEAWLARDRQALAAFEFEETLRPGAAEAVAALQAAGVRVTLLSGDVPGRAAALAARLGITDVLAGVSPEGKLAAVAAAQAAGRRVAMVGDGINDAPVLARADVSLAMGQGALVSRSQADAVLTGNRPGDVVAARHGARKAMRIVRQNLAWAAAYNALCIPLALIGWLPPWAAGLGMAASSLVVVANAARAAR